eukprot:TRINITY_DN3807_c0_g3_i2.p1 TRINITY_DN3807_c0_g3~~TRINITY_DN3807_c0_g3_i2.p1  ORF type:complete len:326 (+),score=68.02 TRINITY_DN3807_c0_g3_i2:168-1145(+)
MSSPLVCDLCSLSYGLVEKAPKILNCGDTFCLLCLAKIIQDGATPDGNITCRICAKVTSLPAEGVTALPTNNVVIKLLKQKQEEENILCAEPDHLAQKLTSFCSSPECMKLICIVCSMTIHKDHDVKTIDKAFEYHRELILSQVQTLKGILVQVDQKAENVNSQISPLKLEKENTEKRIRDRFNKIKDWVSRRETMLLESLNNSAQKISEGLVSSQQMLGTLSSSTKHTIESIESQLNNNSGPAAQLEFLKSTKNYTTNLNFSLETSLQNIKNEDWKIAPTLTFEGYDEATIISFLASVGKVVAKSGVNKKQWYQRRVRGTTEGE